MVNLIEVDLQTILRYVWQYLPYMAKTMLICSCKRFYYITNDISNLEDYVDGKRIWVYPFIWNDNSYFYQNKALISWYIKTCSPRSINMVELVKYNDLELLMEAMRLGSRWTSYVSSAAAKLGYLDLLKYAHNNDYPINYYTLKIAVEYKQFCCVSFLHKCGHTFNMAILNIAIANDDEVCFNYIFCELMNKKDDIYNNIAIKAINAGSRNILLRILQLHECKCIRYKCRIMVNKMTKFNYEYLTFLWNLGIRTWDSHTCTYLAKLGDFTSLDFARLHGCKWNEGVYYAAAKYNHIEILEYAYHYNCPFRYKNTFDKILDLNNEECVQFIISKFKQTLLIELSQEVIHKLVKYV